MKLIVNADDFGLSKGTNYGIIEAHKQGIVTSTTMMITMPEVLHAKEIAEDNPALGIGLHLNITLGKPLTVCPTLIKEDGTFYKPKENPDVSKFSETEIYQEFRAQYELFIQIMGKKPTHMDSHLYAHQIYPQASKAILRLAKEEDIPVRDLDTNYPKAQFQCWFKKQNGVDLKEVFLAEMGKIEDNLTVELMVHPAYIDEYLYEFSTYNVSRMEELEALTSSEVKTWVSNSGVELINYADLRREQCQE